MTFAAPLFLLAALAGLIPVFVHLIHRRKAKVVRVQHAPVPPDQRPEDAPAEVHRGHVALGRENGRAALDRRWAWPVPRSPAWHRSGVGAGPRPSRSCWTTPPAWRWSMAAGPGSTPPARRPSRCSPGCARATRWRSCRPADRPARSSDGSFGPTRPCGRRLDQCRPSYERADLAAKLQQARDLLAQADAPSKEIYVLTDNQSLSWEGLKEPDSRRRSEAGESAPLPSPRGHRQRGPRAGAQRGPSDHLPLQPGPGRRRTLSGRRRGAQLLDSTPAEAPGIADRRRPGSGQPRPQPAAGRNAQVRVSASPWSGRACIAAR